MSNATYSNKEQNYHNARMDPVILEEPIKCASRLKTIRES